MYLLLIKVQSKTFALGLEGSFHWQSTYFASVRTSVLSPAPILKTNKQRPPGTVLYALTQQWQSGKQRLGNPCKLTSQQAELLRKVPGYEETFSNRKWKVPERPCQGLSSDLYMPPHPPQTHKRIHRQSHAVSGI